jgi:hypothetical protein
MCSTVARIRQRIRQRRRRGRERIELIGHVRSSSRHTTGPPQNIGPAGGVRLTISLFVIKRFDIFRFPYSLT